jgi:predicted nucleic acid-binding protein
VTGVLGSLLRAKRTGELPAIRPEMDELRKKVHFFIAPALEARVLSEAGE